VLWRRGPCTVRGVRECFERAEPIGYTTVLKLLQIMTEKGLGGSTLRLLLHALSTRPATPHEVDEIRRLLDQKNGARA
jgi:BlaI family transcriptional regulator, penicillinase repressor